MFGTFGLLGTNFQFTLLFLFWEGTRGDFTSGLLL
ncbi:hypothetical protein SLEP1_g21347 [Rubroshorea leprosula]|uniref:Uncharacterized protein n=1 Tax=Rubroshorea leprosula TaxID=152421 RepID=A0AAV5JGA3_9ROSI|nr:hypothetical protein SLEP1_g21347 [Rubroshorea leprosula]